MHVTLWYASFVQVLSVHVNIHFSLCTVALAGARSFLFLQAMLVCNTSFIVRVYVVC